MSSKPQKSIVASINAAAGEKEIELRRMMREMRSVLVAYSGGVDSTYLSFVAAEELGPAAVCILGSSPSVSSFQKAEAQLAARSGKFEFETVATNEIESAEYAANRGDRCYFCKSELFDVLRDEARRRGIDVIVDGMNADDLSDHRPGRAAADERGIRSPLAELGFSKDDIRDRSRFHGLHSWDKPASPCLSSRIAVGVPVTIGRLGQIEKAEAVIRGKGFLEFRVRSHGELARIEIGRSEMHKCLDPRTIDDIALRLKRLGFKYVTLDLEGFRSGSTNGSGPDDGRTEKKQKEDLEKV